MSKLSEIWHTYSALERRNIAFYIGGIMFYKFGLEFFNGSITTLATDRFNASSAFTKLAAAQGVNQAAQCVGAILIAPLIKKWPTRTVLACAITFFGLMTMILLIVDAATGGKIKPAGVTKPVYGHWNPDVIFGVWTLAGIAYGMVELIRRVIPADIVGGDVGKLRRMDAVVHIFYEVAGTAAAFSSSAAISRFGNNYSFFMSPVFFAAGGIVFMFVSTLSFIKAKERAALGQVEKSNDGNYVTMLWRETIEFLDSVYCGAVLVLSHRRFIWLLPGYSLALYLHRYLESSLAPAFAKRVLDNSAWSQIIVGGSNFGELLGAASVFVLSNRVTTPLPWLRLDAIMLNLVWILPQWAKTATKGDINVAWKIAGSFIPISFGWAAGDVSLAAYIQSVLSQKEFAGRGISALGSVMAFLYSSYIVLYAAIGPALGKIIDNDFKANKNIVKSLQKAGGLQFSICCGIIILASFIPRGAFSLNPKHIGTPTDQDESSVDESSDSNGPEKEAIEDAKEAPEKGKVEV